MSYLSWAEPNLSNTSLLVFDLQEMLNLYLEPSPSSTSPETHKVGENDAFGPMFQVLLVNSEVHLDSLLFTTGHHFQHADNREKTPAGAVEWTYGMRGSLVTQINCPRLFIQILMQDTCLVRQKNPLQLISLVKQVSCKSP